MFLNAFLRHADMVKMANMAQLVNVIPPIFTSPDDVFLQTIFHPLELYATQNGSVSLDAYVDCPTFDAGKYGKVPYLDVSASYEPRTGRVSVNLVNRHRTDAIPVEVECQHGTPDDRSTVFEITGEDIKTINDFDAKENVVTRPREIKVPGKIFTVELPRHSVTMVQLKVQGGEHYDV